MANINHAYDQGELYFIKISDDLLRPAGALRRLPVGPHVIVGHSESGHHHVMLAEKTEVYELPDELKRLQLVVTDPDEAVHLRSFDTHDPVKFGRGTYHAINLREHTPDGWRRQAD